MHALIINIALGVTFSVIMLAFGRPIYRALGGEGAALEAALAYSNVVFAGNVLLWVLNGFASVIRGTGNMLVPALVICAGVVVLIPLSPVLIFGLGPFPALGIAGGGAALLLFYAAGTAVLTWYILSGRNVARLRPSRLRWPLFRDILRRRRGRGRHLGADQRDHRARDRAWSPPPAAPQPPPAMARRRGWNICWSRSCSGSARRWWRWSAPISAPASASGRFASRMAGGAVAFAITEAVGVAAAIWPHAWIALFSADPRVLATGADYLRIVGPTYGFFGLAPGALFCFAGRRPAVLAAVRRLPAHAGRDRRRLACVAGDRLAALAVRRARARALPAWRHPVGGHRAPAPGFAALPPVRRRSSPEFTAPSDRAARGMAGASAVLYWRSGRGRGNTVDQKIISLYDRFTHGGMNRREFLDRLAELAGSTAAAVALLPLLQNNYAQAAIVAPDDGRLRHRARVLRVRPRARSTAISCAPRPDAKDWANGPR